MIQVNRIYLIFNRLVTKKFLVDTSALYYIKKTEYEKTYHLTFTGMRFRETIPRSTFRRSSFTGSLVKSGTLYE